MSCCCLDTRDLITNVCFSFFIWQQTFISFFFFRSFFELFHSLTLRDLKFDLLCTFLHGAHTVSSFLHSCCLKHVFHLLTSILSFLRLVASTLERILNVLRRKKCFALLFFSDYVFWANGGGFGCTMCVCLGLCMSILCMFLYLQIINKRW